MTPEAERAIEAVMTRLRVIPYRSLSDIHEAMREVLAPLLDGAAQMQSEIDRLRWLAGEWLEDIHSDVDVTACAAAIEMAAESDPAKFPTYRRREMPVSLNAAVSRAQPVAGLGGVPGAKVSTD